MRRTKSPTIFDDMNFGWPALLGHVLRNGQVVKPRGFETVECEHVAFTLRDPTRAVTTYQTRGLNDAFSAVEFLWVISGQEEVETLAFFNSKMRDFADRPRVRHLSLDTVEVTPNAVLFGAYGPPIVEQLPYVIENLRADPDSRQAVVSIWRPSPPQTRDVPCTTTLQFLLRRERSGTERRLNMITTMRSNDLWLGTPYDVPLFCRVQQFVAAQLGAPVGDYTHFAGSCHIYKTNYEAAAAVLASEPVERPPYLVVGPLEPDIPTAAAWRVVQAATRGDFGDAPKLYGRGWSVLLNLARDYARRKLAKEAATNGA